VPHHGLHARVRDDRPIRSFLRPEAQAVGEDAPAGPQRDVAGDPTTVCFGRFNVRDVAPENVVRGEERLSQEQAVGMNRRCRAVEEYDEDDGEAQERDPQGAPEEQGGGLLAGAVSVDEQGADEGDGSRAEAEDRKGAQEGDDDHPRSTGAGLQERSQVLHHWPQLIHVLRVACGAGEDGPFMFLS
jgi:hypothetical protein